MKTPKITITFTLEELRELGSIIKNGWGDGDIADGLSASKVRTMMRVMKKLSTAQCELANKQ